MRMVQVDSMARILLCLAVLSSKSFSEENLARLSSYSFWNVIRWKGSQRVCFKKRKGMSVQILDLGGVIASIKVRIRQEVLRM